MRLACSPTRHCLGRQAGELPPRGSVDWRLALPPDTLLLLPEMFATGFTMNSADVAEPIDGPTASFLSDLARRHKIYVQAGIVVRGAGDAQPRNEALMFDPEGRPLARYAKMHLFSFAGEPMHYTAGESPVVFGWQEAGSSPRRSATTYVFPSCSDGQ